MRYSIFLFFSLLLFKISLAQTHDRGTYRLMFYNVQNLFDTLDTPHKNDADFTPEGKYKWNSYRYWQKIKKVYQVIAAVGESRTPEIIALCEIENRLVLEDIVNKTPLFRYQYSIVHHESPDIRGIDCAILFNPAYLSVINSLPVEVKLGSNGERPTRDILYASFKTKKNDTLHVFVNHWPSRLGGASATADKRCIAARMLKQKTDSLQIINKNAKIIVVGDFNDEPNDASIIKCFGVLNVNSEEERFQNLAFKDNYSDHLTIKYKSNWFLFDQILVSKPVLTTKEKGITTICKHGQHIYSSTYLLTSDESYSGQEPFSTFSGYRYNGGFSDHLPVYIDLKE